MVILHPYAPGLRPADQCPTWEALAHLKLTGIFGIHHAACTDSWAYAAWLGHLAAECQGVLIIEHDIVPSQRQVDDMLRCPKPVCASDYTVGPDTLWSSIPGALALGMAKITSTAWKQMQARPRVPRVHWAELAGAMYERLPTVHLHRSPVHHNHVY